MGVIAPLFLAGLAALAVPLVLHLIRRTPRGRQDFSSLMFLSPSPPRLTRHSRLDNLLLLFLRLAALALLTLAFARPFLREAAALRLQDLNRRRVAIVLDVSASMRRGNLWKQAVSEAEQVLADLGPHDDAALFACGDRLRTIVGFDDDKSPRRGNKVNLVRQELRQISPTWEATDLGTAVVAVASELEAAAAAEESPAQPHLVLISDFQKGARLDALQAYSWPARLRLEARALKASETSNAALQLIVDASDEPTAEPRVRIANSADSSADQFYLRWADGNTIRTAGTDGKGSEIATYVPPGQSRVVRLPRAAGILAADRIVLSGDDSDFDNVYYVTPPRQQQIELAYLGSDEEADGKGLLYFLRLALADDPLRKVTISVHATAPAGLDRPPEDRKLVVVTQDVPPLAAAELSRFAEAGGTMLAVPANRAAAKSLGLLFPDVEAPEQPPLAQGQYLLLGEIDFTHPLFAAFASSLYSDFTKIHFWQHRALALKDGATSRVVARFDNGDPALVQRDLGAGRAYLFASGWHPADSQLAISSKFVPLWQAILDEASGGPWRQASLTVGDRAPLSNRAKQKFTVQKPDGQRSELPATADQFGPVEQPGIYRIEHGRDQFPIAVNIASSESNTAPLALEQLEQLGVKLGRQVTRAEELQAMRQQRDAELEERQKIWRWLIVAALGLLILETWLAGRTARQIATPAEAGA